MAEVCEPAAHARQSAARRWLAGGLTLALAAAVMAPAAMSLESPDLALGEFDRLYFAGAGTVRLIQGGTPHLAVQGEGTILQDVTVEIRGRALYIETTGPARELVMELRVADLEQIVSEGDGRITGDGLRFDALRLEGNGAGSFQMRRLEARQLVVRGRGATRFDLTGQVDEQTVELSGTGAYRAAELISNCARVNVAGTSAVRLWAEERLDVEVAGSADIRYAGSPRVRQWISGVASVLHIPQIAI